MREKLRLFFVVSLQNKVVVAFGQNKVSCALNIFVSPLS